MIVEAKILMDCPKDIVGHHQMADYLEKKLKAKRVTIHSWKSGFDDSH